MSAERLLLWMSARGRGSWQQFRAAVEELHVAARTDGEIADEADEHGDDTALPLYQLLRLNLQRLGHAEFFSPATETDWRVTPPTLATITHARGSLGLVIGARSAALLRRLHEAGTGLSITEEHLVAAPDTIHVAAPTPDSLVSFAQQAGLLVQHNAAHAILASLPPIDAAAVRQRVDFPLGAGWRIERFLTKDLRWSSSAREKAIATSAGLFRFAYGHQRYVLFCESGVAFRVPSQVGKYIALRRERPRRRVLAYDVAARTWAVAASCRPPFLVERALIACSGRLPAFDGATGLLRYHDIPTVVAHLAAALLRQELQ